MEDGVIVCLNIILQEFFKMNSVDSFKKKKNLEI